MEQVLLSPGDVDNAFPASQIAAKAVEYFLSEDSAFCCGTELLIDGRVAELSVSYFPADVAEGTLLTTPGDFPPGGVVRVLEDAGHRIIRTYNEARSRLATDQELDAFGTDPALQPLTSRVVLEITHATYGLGDEPLEAVVSIRPAAGNVIVFETYEGAPGEDEDNELATNPDAPTPAS